MEKTLLIGNGINNIYENNPNSWENILKKIAEISKQNIDTTKRKPFPLLYEEIYIKALKHKGISEGELKSFVAYLIDKIEPNEIHELILGLDNKNILTTNYDYSLEKIFLKDDKIASVKNEGIIKETKYSIFRHNISSNRKFWHIHGVINIPNTITLGFEHYGGQLQQIRNYVVTGTNYASKEVNEDSLHKRLKGNKIIDESSWIDFVFKDEVHIIGLSLDYQETDLWYLLTNRARFQLENPNVFKNRIIYYCPTKYSDKYKEQLLRANNIEVKYIDEIKYRFYREVIRMVRND